MPKKGDIPLVNNFNIAKAAPIDDKLLSENPNDRLSTKFKYPGLLQWEKNAGFYFVNDNSQWVNLETWIKQVVGILPTNPGNEEPIPVNFEFVAGTLETVDAPTGNNFQMLVDAPEEQVYMRFGGAAFPLVQNTEMIEQAVANYIQNNPIPSTGTNAPYKVVELNTNFVQNATTVLTFVSGSNVVPGNNYITFVLRIDYYEVWTDYARAEDYDENNTLELFVDVVSFVDTDGTEYGGLGNISSFTKQSFSQESGFKRVEYLVDASNFAYDHIGTGKTKMRLYAFDHNTETQVDIGFIYVNRTLESGVKKIYYSFEGIGANTLKVNYSQEYLPIFYSLDSGEDKSVNDIYEDPILSEFIDLAKTNLLVEIPDRYFVEGETDSPFNTDGKALGIIKNT